MPATSKAADLLNRKAGVFLYPPHIPESFNSLQPLVRHRVEVYGGRFTAHDDISIGGLGWFSVAGSGVKAFDIWLPKGVKLFRRPALFPTQIRKAPPQAFHSKTPRKDNNQKHLMLLIVLMLLVVLVLMMLMLMVVLMLLLLLVLMLLARGPRISAQKRAMSEQIKEEEARQLQQHHDTENTETDAETKGRLELTDTTLKTGTKAAPLVAPENEEEFQLLVSQWSDEGTDQQQQQEEKHHNQQQQQEQQQGQQQQEALGR
ncbi:hypothetical protein, conserved [Eimeria brunetti]|uniref:NOA1/YqeH-like C-terminal domain-containing protein n=1 Tax=Eimeria brunetti TaxID=51314 RepID=U6LM09_9EIME|nr:hypothetical protein, conserved [Eimeria brunetti]